MGTPRTKPPFPEPLFLINEVHEKRLIPLHPETIRQLCRKGPELGGIRSVRYGHHRTAPYWIPLSAINEFNQRNTYNPAA